MKNITNLSWWQKAVFYQIYPRSFADSNADGIGDLTGIISKLDYLQDLGVDAIWLSPHYPSPQFDCGYDISDYTAVEPEYGTLDDFHLLLDGLHKRKMRLILDLVLNHTSDRHPWFIESASSRTNPKRDWYIWADGRNGGAPNNWYSGFGGSAWEHDSRTGQYYYHYFFKQQPDLNWRNPEVKTAMFAAVRFWLEMGVDGFRLDAINTIFEHPDWPDHRVEESLIELRHAIRIATEEDERRLAIERFRQLFEYQRDQPELHILLKELRALVDTYPDRVLVGETDDLEFHGQGNDELHMVFNFPLMRSDHLTAEKVRQNQNQRLTVLNQFTPPAWPCNTLGNHDTTRVYTQFDDGQNGDAWARIALALMLTLKGTPFLYNGEEIGMTDLYLSDLDQFRDILGLWLYHAEREEMGLNHEEALEEAARFSRDRCRTPMQWSDQPNAGFSPEHVSTWLPANPDYAHGVNVASQLQDPHSLLNFYRRLISFRQQTPALVAGDYLVIQPAADECLAFIRRITEQTCLVVLNMTPHTQNIDLSAIPMIQRQSARVLFSTGFPTGGDVSLASLSLAPFAVFIAEL